MFGIGLPEMILILGLALIVVGPDKLPGLARSLAKGILELKNTAQTLKDNIASESPVLKEIQPELEDAAQNIKKQLIDSVDVDQDKEKKDEDYPTGIYDPLEDEDYDDEDDENDFVIEGSLNDNPDIGVEPETEQESESQQTAQNKDKVKSDELKESSGKKTTIHSTVKEDLNKQ